MELCGWSSPGRRLTTETRDQVMELINFISQPALYDGLIWGEEMKQRLFNNSKDIKNKSQLRMIIPIFERYKIIEKGILKANKEINHNNFLNPIGEVLSLLYKMGQIVEDIDNIGDEIPKIIEKKIDTMCRIVFAHGFLYATEAGNGVYVARAVLKTLRKHRTINRAEWFIMTTVISENDNLDQEKELDRLINEYREGKLSVSESDTKGEGRKENSYSDWIAHLLYANLIDEGKQGRKKIIKMKEPKGDIFDKIIEAILDDKFFAPK